MWDFLLDSIHTVIKNGFTVSSAVAVFILLLKNRKLKQRINRHLPRMLRDQEQDKLDYIIHLLEGGQPCANLKASASSAKNARTPSTSHSEERSVARFVARFTIYPIMRRMKRMNKFLRKIGSRKFWGLVSVLVASNLILFGVDAETTEKITAIIAQLGALVTYLIVEGGIDKEAQKQQVYIVPGSAPVPKEPEDESSFR